MTDFADLRAEMKSEFAAAGLWIPIRVTSDASPPVVTDTHANYRAPDNVRVNGSISDDHEIEYVAADLPTLAEGHLVDFLDDAGDPLAGRSFKVRQPPYITDNPADDQSGYFKRALLTRIV